MTIESYLNELKANGRSKSTIHNQRWVLERLDKFKSIDTCTKEDLIEFFNQLKAPANTVRLFQTMIKSYFKDKPELVSWIKKVASPETLKSDDILTTENINAMINTTESYYWKALIAFLFETGCRISEASSLKFKDFIETNDGMIVNIPTQKTQAGYRKTILPFSAQYIRNLKTYTNAKAEDIVFWKVYSQTYQTLSKISKDAGIKKPMSPHKFRHAQATSMVQLGYNEAIIRKKLGWSPTSSTIARYQHLSDTDVIDATLSNTGKMPKTAVRTELKEAEKLTLVDAASQFSKLSSENEEFKAKMDKMEQNEKDKDAKIEFLTNAVTKILAETATFEIGKEILKHEKKGK